MYEKTKVGVITCNAWAASGAVNRMESPSWCQSQPSWSSAAQAPGHQRCEAMRRAWSRVRPTSGVGAISTASG